MSPPPLAGDQRQRRVRAVEEAEQVHGDHLAPLVRCRRRRPGRAASRPRCSRGCGGRRARRAPPGRSRAPGPRRRRRPRCTSVGPSRLSASASSRSVRRAPSATLAPASDRARAVASPIPEEAPVTAATRPSSGPGMAARCYPAIRRARRASSSSKRPSGSSRRVPEQLAQPRQPVAHGLRVHVQRLRDRLGAPAVAKPGVEGRAEPLAREVGLGLERRERRLGHVARQAAVGAEQQRQLVASPPAAGRRRPRSPPSPASRSTSRARAKLTRGLLPGHRRPERRPAAAHRRLELARRRPGAGTRRHDERRHVRHERLGAEPKREPVGLLAARAVVRLHDEHGEAARQPPGRVRRRGLHRGRRPPAAPARAGRPAAGGGAGARRPRPPARARSPRSSRPTARRCRRRSPRRARTACAAGGRRARPPRRAAARPRARRAGRRRAAHRGSGPPASRPRPRFRYTSRPSSRSAPGFPTMRGEAARAPPPPRCAAPARTGPRAGARSRARRGSARSTISSASAGQLGAQHLGHLRRQALPWMLGDHLWRTYKKRVPIVSRMGERPCFWYVASRSDDESPPQHQHRRRRTPLRRLPGGDPHALERPGRADWT